MELRPAHACGPWLTRQLGTSGQRLHAKTLAQSGLDRGGRPASHLQFRAPTVLRAVMVKLSVIIGLPGSSIIGEDRQAYYNMRQPSISSKAR
jgi:hypothetical protein